MLEKVATHSGITRQHESSASATPNTPGRLISNRVFVGNIPPNLVERDLIMLFNRFGKIRDVKIIPEHARNKSYGFVTFFSEADARRAIQASVQNDSVMWGDRKLNVAPAVKRANSNNHNPLPANSNSYYQTPNRLAHNPFYATSVPVPNVNTMYTTNTGVVSPTDQSQSVDHMQVDASNNAMYQTAVICRLPHQYAMAQCHQYSSSSSGHYFVSPGFQPYVQPGSPIPAGHQASHYASYASITSMPLTPPCSSASRENSAGTDGQSDVCADSSGGDSGSQGGVAGGEKNAAEVLPNDSSNENSHQSAGPNNDSPYPLHTTIMCCPHHSCMLSPISPIQHMPNQAVAAAGLARSCLSLHGHPASNCPYPPNSPLMYSSPMVYNPARRSSSARLQRWNSLDANLTGLSHGHHQHQSPNGYWGNESAWSRPSLLDDSYGSETGLYQGPRGFDRPLRPAFSCQSHHGGMFSPFCRSYEYNIWGQGHAPNSGSLDYVDQSGNPNTTAASQMSMSAQSHSSLALNLNESGTEQLQQHPKK
ncbi:uncharacterized protein LOC124314082 [Daphnia pulicaria]|uniref:uncharacterized protein LOC124314082 n=1 Tax=Daphnia pulicaria TaxID=35523 RepID=UPI001EEBB2BD|nr:uncharacterized protein LOC124314082 [Daphnia pulicaria]